MDEDPNGAYWGTDAPAWGTAPPDVRPDDGPSCEDLLDAAVEANEHGARGCLLLLHGLDREGFDDVVFRYVTELGWTPPGAPPATPAAARPERVHLSEEERAVLAFARARSRSELGASHITRREVQNIVGKHRGREVSHTTGQRVADRLVGLGRLRKQTASGPGMKNAYYYAE